jgi:hydroxymethylbilane synthase
VAPHIGNPPIPLPKSPSRNLALKLGTRGSPLALAQAREVASRLAAAHGETRGAVEIVIVKTSGDLITDRPLGEAGGKGLFTKELDIALAAGEIDLAVHSAKDLPTILPAEITILGFLKREDVRDAWISPHADHPSALPPGSIVGTASLRRAAMVKRLRPDLVVTLLRGNVETRLAKVASGEVHATLLALAGLKRLGLADKATSVLATEDFVPAAGQGAIAITTRTDDSAVAGLIAPILDPATGGALAAERAVLRLLDGSCKTPIGAFAEIEQEVLRLDAIVLAPDGSQWFEARISGPCAEAVRLGEAAGRDLLARIPSGFFEG